MTRRLDSQVNDDPLNFLPRKPVQEFPKHSVIYSSQQPSDHLYVVIQGRVKITCTDSLGHEVIARFVPSEGLFGESALLGRSRRAESAVALDDVSAMSWSSAEIEQQIEREPRLGIALSQYLVSRCVELQERIEQMAVQKTPERVVMALLQLGVSLGTTMPDGTTRIDSLTHHVIAEYVGTSREIVTFQMNRLRRLGLLNYSRRSIDIKAAAMRDMLKSELVQAAQAG